MLIDRQSWPQHRPWAWLVGLGTVAAAVWFVVEWRRLGFVAGGAGWCGLSLGVVAGAICLFEFLLWPRMRLVLPVGWSARRGIRWLRLRSMRIGRTQTWLRAHIWLGLASLPLAVLHSGFRWGGELSAWLLAILIAVVASGVVGLALQQFVPRVLLEEIPNETIYSQIAHVMEQSSDDALRLVGAVCGKSDEAATQLAERRDRRAEGRGGIAVRRGRAATSDGDGSESYFVVGAPRSAGRLQGRVLGTQAAVETVPGTDDLWTFHVLQVDPYMLHGRHSRSTLQSPLRSAEAFRHLRNTLPAGAHGTLAALEMYCEQRRQLDRQSRLHLLLHGWLWLHVPLSVALMLLLSAHVFVALKY